MVHLENKRESLAEKKKGGKGLVWGCLQTSARGSALANQPHFSSEPRRESKQVPGLEDKCHSSDTLGKIPLLKSRTKPWCKMSLKLPRNWDFNLKMDAGKIARSRSMMTGDPMAACNWMASHNQLERPLKIGWLKKQRSIVKNWQQRYFVLKGQQLFYYKDEEDAKPQGCLFLQGSTIKEAAGNPEEAGKFIFEIIPVVFGQRLAETVAYEQKFGKHPVPILMEKCAEFIREHGMNEEGIFRLPGQDNLVKHLRDAFDAGERPSFDRDTDVHTVASLFKLYLRELPEPVVPWLQYEDFLLCGMLLNADEMKGQQELVKQLSLLPRVNYNLLSYICRFLHEIQLNSSINKMSVDNLATVIGVNLIRPKIEDPAAIMRGTPQIQRVMTVMISDHAKLFPISKDESSSPPSQRSNSKKIQVPRSSVGWDAAEEPPASKANILTQGQTRDDLDASSPTSSGAAAQLGALVEDNDTNQPKDALGMWKTQSRKRTQTLPNRKSFLTDSSQGEKANSDKNDIFCNDFWTSSGSQVSPTFPTDGHKRTLSQDLCKLLDLHRTSTYDNVPTCQAEGRENTCTRPLRTASCNSKKDLLASQSPSLVPKELVGPNHDAEDCGSGQENQESLQKMILELKKEMEMQKKDYEEQMKSLHKENYEVWAKVVRLNEEIEKEKKKFVELELKLQNVERAREDVEKRNKVLEKEVQDLVKSRSDPRDKRK
ncbi:rho GTPase-activating protein 25 isoform X2 [Pelodiscus sinensis]|uniref:rho GTPase-activating protein 25 isoform X2 n=1 Tax=Pelodiscus sinensis TaxID=13735 RepID=UPI0007044249|nr:rho GTPase-activating protein 25 isoform X2 [Pelodiscus sinensis]|eukprot:XP_006110854.2 rho GTPase-activating protein 25 isoform X2 [Pelodiscus sinensis]